MKQILVALLALLVAAPLSAQNANNQSQLRLVVVDETGAGIPQATITVTPAAGEPVTFTSDDRGLAMSPQLATGNVQIHVEFPGFETYDGQVTLRRGAVNQTVTLKIAGFQEEVVVNDTSATDDRRGNSFTTTLEQAEIDELPDDPEELADVLTQMAGAAGATFQVNGFRGGRLPSRDEIRQIRFRTNSLSADNHDAGRTQIEIITRPNVVEWNGNASLNYRGDEMNARNAFASTESPEQNRQFNMGLRGPLVKGKTSIRLNVDGRRDQQSDTITALDENGNRMGDVVFRPSEQTNVTVGIEHALTKNQTLRVEYRRGDNSTDNLGVGGFNLQSRAYDRNGSNHQVRAQVQGLLGKTTLNELRLQFTQQRSEAASLSNDRAVIVLDTFSDGGAGIWNNSFSRGFELADNLDFNVGRKHQMRVGILLEGDGFSNFDAQNNAGTFTFSGIDAFEAGRPTSFTQRNGQVDTKFNQYQFGAYWQDDIRLSSKLSVSIGVRNEMQSHIDDKLNLMPRLGFTATPWGPRTSIRGGYGLFYDWYSSNLYDQTLRVDGVNVRDIRVSCLEENGFCADVDALDPTSAGVLMTAAGRIQASEDLSMPRVHQASIGYDRQLTPAITLQTSYQMLRGENLMRSRNINAPVDGVRPNPAFGDIVQFESTGRSESDRLTIGTRFRTTMSAGQQTPLMFNVNYTLGREKNFADSATSLPSDSLNPDVDWGPSRQDIRHRLQLQANVPMLFGVRGNFSVNVASGVPYTMTTGSDDNDDGVFNDRPVGVGRNTLRGDATWGLNLNLSKRFTLGAPATPVTQQQRGFGGPGGGARGQGGQTGSRTNVEIFVQAQNILNHVTKTGYTGNLSSPFFGTATSVGAPRDINVGLRFNF